MKLLLYCTRPKNNNDHLIENYDNHYILTNKLTTLSDELNGKVVGECDFEVEEIKPFFCENIKKFEKESCLTMGECAEYLKGFYGYAIHIKNLHIFDEPKELSEYYHYNKGGFNEPINNAPQNMMYAYNKYLWKFVLISIHPEYLCKILNGEKTIEVRKKVLKEML